MRGAPVPPASGKVILWAHDFEFFEEHAHFFNIGRRITNIVIGQDNLLAAGEAKAGVNAVYFII